MDATTILVASLFFGLIIGLLSGLLGVGGGTIMVPLFRLLYNMPAVMATATSMFTIIPTSISGLVMHIRHKTCLPKLGIVLGLGGALISPIGVWLAQISPSWLVMVVAAVVIGYSAYNMVAKALKMKPAKKGEKRAKAEAETDAAAGAGAVGAVGAAESAAVGAAKAGDADATSAEPSDGETFAADSFKLNRKNAIMSVGIGMIAGLASGYIGVGGGFLMIPLMLGVLNIPMKLASGTSLIAITILSVPGVIEQGMLGNINYMAGIAIAVGSIPGAIIGARLVKRVPERTLRLAFGALLAFSAVMLVVKEFGLLG